MYEITVVWVSYVVHVSKYKALSYRTAKRRSKGEPRFDPKMSKKALRWKKKCSEKWQAYFKEHPDRGSWRQLKHWRVAAGTTGSAAA